MSTENPGLCDTCKFYDTQGFCHGDLSLKNCPKLVLRQRLQDAEANYNDQMAAAYNNAVRQINDLKAERDAAVRERDALQSEYNKVYDALGLEQQRADRAERERDAACEALRFYAEEDRQSVELEILESANFRPATAALAAIEGGQG